MLWRARVRHMTAEVTRPTGPPPDRDWYRQWFAERDLSPSWWSNDPGYRYPAHEHAYRKVLFCAEGQITFHVDGADLALAPGDRLDVAPHTPHAATVGDRGVTCVEAAVR